MKIKNFIVAGVVGGLVNFLLGWLFYGMLFKDFFPQDDSNMRMVFIFLGCLMYGLFIAYIFTKWAGISYAATGAKAGAIIGFFFAVSVNLFMMSSIEPDYQLLVMDTAISIVMSAIVGAVIAVVNGKIK